jgi:hypothetical protein
LLKSGSTTRTKAQLSTVAQDGPRVPKRQPAKPRNRRAKVLIVVGIVVLLVVVAGTLLLSGGGDDAGPPIGEPPGGGEGEDDWSLELALVGAVTGVGSLVLGIADFVRNSVRYSRDRRGATTDWQHPGGYL